MSAPNIIPSIFTAKDMVSMPVGVIGASVSRLGVITDATAARMSRSFTLMSTKAYEVGAATRGLALGIMVPLGLATHAAVEFEQQMGNVGTLIDTTKESLSDMSDEVLKLSKRIPKPMHDLTKGLYQIRSDGIAAGNGINQAFGVLESSGKLAVAGLSTLEEAAKTVTSAMNVFSDAGLNSQEIANSMFKTVQGGKTTMAELGASFGKNAAIIHSAGVSLYEMNAATAAITATGITASQAQNELGASVLALMKPTGNLQTIFENLGYAGEGGFKKLIGSAGGLVPALDVINAKAKELGITMSEGFGRKEALVANILISKWGQRNAAYLEELAKQMDGVNTLNGKFAEQSKTAAAQMELFKNSATRLGVSLGNSLIPALNHLMKIVEPVIDGIAEFGQKHKTITGIIVDSLGTIGLLAVGISAVSFAFGTLGKSMILIEGAIKTYNFLAGFAAVKTGAFTGALAENAAASKGAAFAMNGFGNSVKSTIASVSVLLLGLYEVNNLMNEWSGKNQLQKENAKSDRWMNTSGSPMRQKLVDKGFSPAQIDSAAEAGYMGFDMPELTSPSKNASKALTASSGETASAAPFVKLGSGVPGGSQSGGTGGGDSQHKVVLEINNNTGNQITASGANAAVGIKIKTNNTFSREA